MDETVIEGRRVSLIYSGQVLSEGSCDPVESGGSIEDQGGCPRICLTRVRGEGRRKETRGGRRRVEEEGAAASRHSVNQRAKVGM